MTILFDRGRINRVFTSYCEHIPDAREGQANPFFGIGFMDAVVAFDGVVQQISKNRAEIDIGNGKFAQRTLTYL